MRKIITHSLLFLLTLITATLTGAESMFANSFLSIENPLGWEEFWQGLQYSLPFLGILSLHKLGRYLMAQRHKIELSLPYFMPFWMPGLPIFGTLGALMRMKEAIKSRRAAFDLGVAGPMLAFAATVILLTYAFSNLPPAEHIFSIHPEYQEHGLDYAQHVYKDRGTQLLLGSNLLFEIMQTLLVDDPKLMPPPQEMMHYPYLLAGYFACFFIALYLFPLGRMDGAHILRGLVGKDKQRTIASIVLVGIVFYGGLGMYTLYDTMSSLIFGIPLFIFFNFYLLEKIMADKLWVLVIATAIFLIQFILGSFYEMRGFSGWLFFAFFIGRITGVHQLPTEEDAAPLSTTQQVLGWASIVIFILCFLPLPFIFKD